MPMEFTGTLIEMNAKYATKGYANLIIIVGAITIMSGFLFLISELIYGEGKTRVIRSSISGFVILIGISLVIFAFKIPKDHIIKCCANGPVSIERISTLYDIIDVDGKEITLRERR